MKKQIFALALILMMLLSMSACSASSTSTSTTTVTTSKTDENGNTNTNTTTSEVGVTVGTDGISATTNHSSDTQTNSAEDIIAYWYDTYSAGATGENENGDRFLLAYDDPENITEATLTIIGADGSLYIREGYIQKEGEGEDAHFVLIDETRDVAVPFIFYESEQGDFEMYFLADGDTAVMTACDQEIILSEMRDILEQTQIEPEVNTATAKKNGSSAAAAKSGAKSEKGYDAAKVRAEWESVFMDGAEGRNDNGEYFLLAMDDSEKCNYVALMIMSADLKTLELYTTGYLKVAEEGYVIVDDHSDMTVPFTITSMDDGFDMGFQDGDVAHMVFVSQEVILDDMLAIIDAVMD